MRRLKTDSVVGLTAFPNLAAVQFHVEELRPVKGIGFTDEQTVSDTQEQTHKFCSGHLNMACSKFGERFDNICAKKKKMFTSLYQSNQLHPGNTSKKILFCLASRFMT